MGLFSRRNKKSEAEARAAEMAAAQQRAAQQAVAEQMAAQQAAAKAAAAKKAAADQERAKEEKIMANTTAKRRQIEVLERAIKRFEKERAEEARMALAAQKAKNKNEARRHADKAKRLKDRIESHDNQIRVLQQQLYALEDTGAHLNHINQMTETTSVINDVKIDADTVSDALQDMRESVQAAQDVQDTLKADANLYGAQEDPEDLLAELAEEYGDDVTESIPSVPDENPKMPAAAQAASKTPVDAEEDEIRRLEADIAL